MEREGKGEGGREGGREGGGSAPISPRDGKRGGGRDFECDPGRPPPPPSPLLQHFAAAKAQGLLLHLLLFPTSVLLLSMPQWSFGAEMAPLLFPPLPHLLSIPISVLVSPPDGDLMG